MNIMTLDSSIAIKAALIVSHEAGDLHGERKIPPESMHKLNDEVCMEFTLNISTGEAIQCESLNAYIELVKTRM